MAHHTGDCFLRCCSRLNKIPAAILCVAIYSLQVGVLDFYLVRHLGVEHLAWLALDVPVLILLIACIVTAALSLDPTKVRGDQKTSRSSSSKASNHLAWVTWLIMGGVLAAKVIVGFLRFSVDLEENDKTFFGPNTFKTTIALGSCIFLLFLSTQHDAPAASERRKFIEALTETVFLDLIDTTDILEVLFDKDLRQSLLPGLEEVILGVATLNLVLPTVPLITLSRSRFGRCKVDESAVVWHRMSIIILVNVPNLLVRIVLWHGSNVGISPFTLKNLILIGWTLYEFYEHKLEAYEMRRERERVVKEDGRVAMEMDNAYSNSKDSVTAFGQVEDRLEAGDSNANPVDQWCVRRGSEFTMVKQ